MYLSEEEEEQEKNSKGGRRDFTFWLRGAIKGLYPYLLTLTWQQEKY